MNTESVTGTQYSDSSPRSAAASSTRSSSLRMNGELRKSADTSSSATRVLASASRICGAHFVPALIRVSLHTDSRPLDWAGSRFFWNSAKIDLS